MNSARIDSVLNGRRVARGMSRPHTVLSRLLNTSIYTKLLVILFFLTLPLVNPWVRGDGVGYYAYLRSSLIDHDLNFEKDWLGANQTFLAPRIDAQGHLLREQYTSTGHVGNHFSVGAAMFWAPVLAVVHVGVLTANSFGAHIAADGYSRPYVLALALTTASYGFLAMIFAYRIARKYFEERWAFLGALGIWLASSLPVYMYFNPSWSHAISAFAVALYLWYWDRTQLQRTISQWTILGVLAGLMGNVYYPNVLLLIFPLVELFYLLFTAKRRNDRPSGAGTQQIARVCVFGAGFLFSLSPTFITRQIIYGTLFETGYPGIRTWNWTSPVLLQVLFSSDHGMWSWTPVLFFAMFGLFFLYRHSRLLGVGSIFTALAYYYFIASYPTWDGLSSYGNRFFVSLTPIFVLGLTALLSEFARWMGNPSRAMSVSAAAILLLALWNGGFIFQWGTHMVPARGEISWSQMVNNQFIAVPSRLKSSMESYLLHRKDLMEHIEEGDVEQQRTHPHEN